MSVREDIAAQLEQDAAQKHARWDGRTWRELVDGPAAALERSLGATSGRVLAAYLELAAEGVALGYLFPASARAVGFLDTAFRDLIPSRLVTVPEPARLPTLAALWNLGENLEAQPGWMSAVFLRRLQAHPRLDELEALVDEVSAALERSPAPGTPLRKSAWVDVSAQDVRFLPGAMHFLTPVILCVHDRLRIAAAGRPPETTGVWLQPEPLVLGPTRCTHAAEAQLESAVEVAGLMKAEPLIDEVFSSARSAAGLVVALRTSQHLVAVTP